MSNSSTEETIVGIFEKRQDAQRAVRQLSEAGFSKEQIGFLAKNVEKPDDLQEEVTTGAMTGAAMGAVGGAALGMGMIVGVIPVIGPVLAIGAAGTLLLNAAGGAAVAGLTGALTAWGISDADAHFYQSELGHGKYLVSVEVSTGYDKARRILEDNHGALRGVPRPSHAENRQSPVTPSPMT